jgi:hypothetical protein
MKKICRVFIFALILSASTSFIWAANGTVWAPAHPRAGFPLREEFSLNGIWDFTPSGAAKTSIAVPEFWDAQPGFTCTQAVYQRQVTVPPNWTGKRIFLEFESVNHVATVSVNGTQLGKHIGGWVPFRYDITSLASPGSTITVRVAVQAGNAAPILDSAGKPLWPLGWDGKNMGWGIIHPVWLRAYGQVAIDDAFIQPSFRRHMLTVDYTITNRDSTPRTVNLSATIQDDAGVTTLLNVPAQAVTLAAGEKKTVRVSAPWTNPVLWFPDQPKMLRLSSTLTENAITLDHETRPFGFREVWIEGGRYILNGVRINLIGTSPSFHSYGEKTSRYTNAYPSNWANTLNKLKATNVNVLRLHMEPAPSWMLEECDRLGMMIIQESALYATQDKKWPTNKKTWLDNYMNKWVPEWVPSFRNHPSIVLISLENEFGLTLAGLLNDADITNLADAVRKYDWSRPLCADGDARKLETVNYHYPEGYSASPSGSIYKWNSLLSAGKPTGVGEFITDYGTNSTANRFWQGTWSRGLRYLGFADIRPYTTIWAISGTGTDAINLKNSFAPVALFDYAYDDLGIAPIRGTSYPNVTAGSIVSRSLILYNDEYRDTSVTVQVAVKSGTQTLATGTRTYTVTLGQHIVIPCSFQVPYKGGATMDLVLTTSKAGVQKFTESKRFIITGATVGSSNNVVTLGDVPTHPR